MLRVFSKDNIPKNPIKFQTHDNYDRPFQIIIDKTGIDIEHNDFKHYEDDKDVFVPFKHYDWSEVCEVMVPDNIDTKDKYGNSVLIELVLDHSSIKYISSSNFYYDSSVPVNHQYVHYGSDAYSFLTDRPITGYGSYIGNNDIPYPVAISDNKIYFFLDHCYVTDKEFAYIGIKLEDYDWYDGYEIFYRYYDNLKIEPMNGLCILQHRMVKWFSNSNSTATASKHVERIKKKKIIKIKIKNDK
jgi:hypothetical protein